MPLFGKGGAADNIPFQLSAVITDINVDFGGLGLKIRHLRKVRLLMLGFDSMIG